MISISSRPNVLLIFAILARRTFDDGPYISKNWILDDGPGVAKGCGVEGCFVGDENEVGGLDDVGIVVGMSVTDAVGGASSSFKWAFRLLSVFSTSLFQAGRDKHSLRTAKQPIHAEIATSKYTMTRS
jgi:hypothetical protein